MPFLPKFDCREIDSFEGHPKIYYLEKLQTALAFSRHLLEKCEQTNLLNKANNLYMRIAWFLMQFRKNPRGAL